MNHGNEKFAKIIKILKSAGWTFRLTTVQEKRECAKNHKKSYRGNPHAAKYSFGGKQDADVYFNFKKEVFACFYCGQFDRFMSRREICHFFRNGLNRYDADDIILTKHLKTFENKKFEMDRREALENA